VATVKSCRLRPPVRWFAAHARAVSLACLRRLRHHRPPLQRRSRRRTAEECRDRLPSLARRRPDMLHDDRSTIDKAVLELDPAHRSEQGRGVDSCRGHFFPSFVFTPGGYEGPRGGVSSVALGGAAVRQMGRACCSGCARRRRVRACGTPELASSGQGAACQVPQPHNRQLSAPPWRASRFERGMNRGQGSLFYGQLTLSLFVES
jgi:hypothetical protein